MESTGTHSLVAMAHLVVLALWGGVVATEAVLEIAPIRHRELHTATIRLHYWIDLLVELPLVLGVVATGVTLIVLTETLSTLHLVKIGFAAGAVAITLYCIAVVIRRARWLEADAGDPRLWWASRRVLWCFATGLAAAAVAATLGFTLALSRPGGTLM